LPVELPSDLPKDLFNGKNFEYTKNAGDFVLYCKGKNLDKNNKIHDISSRLRNDLSVISANKGWAVLLNFITAARSTAANIPSSCQRMFNTIFDKNFY